MAKSTKKKEVVVKAFGVFHTGVGELSDTIFEEKYKANAYISAIAYPYLEKVPLENIKEILEQYKIIPIKITYTLNPKTK